MLGQHSRSHITITFTVEERSIFQSIRSIHGNILIAATMDETPSQIPKNCRLSVCEISRLEFFFLFYLLTLDDAER